MEYSSTRIIDRSTRLAPIFDAIFIRRQLLTVVVTGLLACRQNAVNSENPEAADLVGSSFIYSSDSNDFYNLVVSDVPFVDKSLFIESYLQSPTCITLISRPKRWGKSTNMDMLKRFLAFEVNGTGFPLTAKELVNRKLFVGGEAKLPSTRAITLNPLKISNSSKSMRSQGRSPVLHTSWATVGATDFNGTKCFLKWKIEKMFVDHYYLKLRASSLNGTNFTASELDTLDVYLNRSYSDDQLTESIRFLSGLLYKYYGNRKVHVLVDDFDTPIISLYLNVIRQFRRLHDFATERELFERALQSEEMQLTLNLFRNLLGNGLWKNPVLKKALISGAMTLASVDLLADARKSRKRTTFKECTLLDEEFSDSYGFSQREVDRLLNESFVWTRRDNITSRYLGYNIGRGKFIYHPWSIKNVIEYRGQLRYYWTNNAYTGLIEDAIISEDIQKQLEQLVKGESVKVPITYPIALKDGAGDDFYNILLFSGHLTLKNDTRFFEERHFGNATYELVIPNEEVKKVCNEKVLVIWY